MPNQYTAGPLPIRFWRKVERAPDDGCWRWTARLNHNGYGLISISNNGQRKRTLAHRIAWELTNGPIPDGLFVLHRCDNPTCCNPAHLFLGTQADNNRDMWSKGRGKRGRGSHGMEHGQAKLTDDAVKNIRLRYAAGGVTIRALAIEYSVSPMTIHDVIRGKSWRHVT